MAKEFSKFCFEIQVQALESLVKSERFSMEHAFDNQKRSQLRTNDRAWQLKLEAVNRWESRSQPEPVAHRSKIQYNDKKFRKNSFNFFKFKMLLVHRKFSFWYVRKIICLLSFGSSRCQHFLLIMVQQRGLTMRTVKKLCDELQPVQMRNHVSFVCLSASLVHFGHYDWLTNPLIKVRDLVAQGCKCSSCTPTQLVVQDLDNESWGFDSLCLALYFLTRNILHAHLVV